MLGVIWWALAPGAPRTLPGGCCTHYQFVTKIQWWNRLQQKSNACLSSSGKASSQTPRPILHQIPALLHRTKVSGTHPPLTCLALLFSWACAVRKRGLPHLRVPAGACCPTLTPAARGTPAALLPSADAPGILPAHRSHTSSEMSSSGHPHAFHNCYPDASHLVSPLDQSGGIGCSYHQQPLSHSPG